MELASDIEAHDEVDRFDVVHVEGTAHHRRDLEVVHLPGIGDQAPALSAEGQAREQVQVLAAGCRQVSLQRLGVRPHTRQGAFQRVQIPKAVIRPEEHVAEDRGEQWDLARGSDPSPRVQTTRELLGSERSCEVHQPIEPRHTGA